MVYEALQQIQFIHVAHTKMSKHRIPYVQSRFFQFYRQKCATKHIKLKPVIVDNGDLFFFERF